MENQRTIGKVVLVESDSVIVELDTSSKSMTKTFLTGTYPIARINSYVLIPVGAVSIVGIVTRVSMTEQDLEIAEKGSLTLAHPRRTIFVTMVGTMTKKGGKFEFSYGIKEFPALDNPVWFILEEELDVIFDKQPNDKFFIELGTSTAYPEYKVKVNPNLLLSRHLAVLGNTGAGKSCTIASLIQTILQRDEVVKGGGAHFVIFDTNGEYRSAFSKGDKKFSLLHIGQEGLKIPYWFMNLQDFRDLFRVTGGVQEPVLSTAISVSKQRSLDTGDDATEGAADVFLMIVSREFEKIRADLNPDNPKAEAYVGTNIISNCDSLLGICEKYNDEIIRIEKQLGGVKIKDIAIEIKSLCPTRAYEKMIATTKAKISEIVEPIINKFTVALGSIFGEGISGKKLLDVDSPMYFDLGDFFERALPIAMRIQGGQSERIKEYCSTMLLRIRRLISDQRYNALFQRTSNYPDALASFLRMCFGRMKNAKIEELGPLEKIDEHYFVKMYLDKHEQEPKKDYQVVIFDLSLVPSDVLENVTALLGRLILEFMQRIEKAEIYKGKDVRGKFPIVLVLEEAHNYIPDILPKDTESVSKQVFERIAREGRKYGLSLVVSSQRPSELSRTVLSQCNSFITHRIQNPEDQAYIKKLLPTISHDLLNQLPILAQGVALIFGDCVRAPMEVLVRKPNPEPKSDDPKFWEHWTNKKEAGEFQFENGEPNFEDVCFVWEGGRRTISEKSKYAATQPDAKAKEGEGTPKSA